LLGVYSTVIHGTAADKLYNKQYKGIADVKMVFSIQACQPQCYGTKQTNVVIKMALQACQYLLEDGRSTFCFRLLFASVHICFVVVQFRMNACVGSGLV
jgi:hypothetical protein